MLLQSARRQLYNDDLIDFSSTITLGGTPQLVLPQQPWRSYLLFHNCATHTLVIDFGPATATATLTSGAVSSVAVNDGGMNYTIAPQVHFLGGVIQGDVEKAPGNNWPGHAAKATATLSTGAVSAITVSDGGASYVVAPLVVLVNSLDRSLGGGTKVPSATSGIQVVAGGTVVFENTFCPSSAMSVYGGTTNDPFVCKVFI